MFKGLKNKAKAFFENTKDYPLLVGFIAGVYPLLFFYSNNYPAINSLQHFLFFSCIFIVLPVIGVFILYKIFGAVKKLRPYRGHMLFVMLIVILSTLLSQALFLTLKKKILLGILIVACLLSIKLYRHYKRIIVIIGVMAIMPLFKCLVNIYEHARPMSWTVQKDAIANVKFKHTPNIYMIQPDGYVSRDAMEKAPYNHTTDLYGWLENNNFKVYNNFRSNYPASLASNASMFAMKHHYFDDVLFPTIEMPNARKAILDNDAVRILKNNNYETFFIAHDEYFQQNLSSGIYDHYNIMPDEISYFTNGNKLERDAYEDLKKGMAVPSDKPKFFFVEKVLPHHVHFYAPGNRIETERKEYLDNVEVVNKWLKTTIKTITDKDPEGIIIILADHGGWVGMENENEFYSTSSKPLIHSTFDNLAAIKWNTGNHGHYDANLVSNVNVFRVLFSYLSNDKSYLNAMEEDASYNLRYDNSFFMSVYKLIDGKGEIVNEKHN